jgi:hypothetical protein
MLATKHIPKLEAVKNWPLRKADNSRYKLQNTESCFLIDKYEYKVYPLQFDP